MNKFQKCIATGAVAWLAVVLPTTIGATFGSSLLFDLSYLLPAAALTAFIWLVGFIWLAICVYGIVKIWSHN